MIAEYRRDMNHNYLILTGDEEADTTSYPVRMLLGNTVPALLKCRLQGLDGKSLFYYEITSRQPLASFYENRLLGVEDLQFILDCLIRTLEKLQEYLLNPEYLVINPDYIFLDLEKKELQFCYFPGDKKMVGEQFRQFVEYLLPKLDHSDEQAVSLGYSVYRKALEDTFQLEDIQGELYQSREEQRGNGKFVRESPGSAVYDSQTGPVEMNYGEKAGLDELFQEREFDDREKWEPQENGMFLNEQIPDGKAENVKRKKENGDKSRNKKEYLVILTGCAVGVGAMLAVLIASQLGYLPQISVEKILVCILAGTGVGIFLYQFLPSLLKKSKREGTLDAQLQKAAGRHAQNNGEEPDLEMKKILDENFIDESSQTSKSAEKIHKSAKSEHRKGNAWKKEAGDYHETVILSMGKTDGPASLVSREPGEFATIFLSEEMTVIGKMKTAADAVIPLPTISRIHAKIRKKDEEYYLTDLNSRNGTSVNGRMLQADEEYLLQDEDEIDFAQARYIFLK